ncbi:MAG: transposase [Anaplasmataceae bacterium]|nr:transposase [Anaplasmataceae bacterium]
MDINVTAKIQLLPTKIQKIDIDNTLIAIKNSLNYTSRVAYKNNRLSNKTKIQKLVYYDIREKYGIKSQMACNVCVAVGSTYSSMKSNKQNTLAVYNNSKLTYSYNRDWNFTKNNQVSISTLNSREKLDYRNTGLENYLDGTWQYCSAELVKKDNKYYLHVVVKKNINQFELEKTDNVIGIDVGMRQLATAIDSKDKIKFINGRNVKEKKSQFVKTRKELQERNTASSKRRLRKIGQRENRYQNDINHCISKALVNFGKDKNTLFVLEDLRNIRLSTEKVQKKNRYYSVSWAFADLRSKIEYKVQKAGMQVIAVNPKYTSQKCPKCGHTEKKNRNKKLHLFCCKTCSYKSNDDRIGAINLRQIGIEYIHNYTASLEVNSTKEQGIVSCPIM